MDIVERARNYVAKAPPSVSGCGGHRQTFSVAVALVHGFALDVSTARTLLQEYNSRCQPPWNERDLEHKLRSAESTPHDKPRGHLRGVVYQYSGASQSMPQPITPPPVRTEIKTPVKRYKLDQNIALPKPMDDPCRQFVVAAFQPGEGISIERATLNEERKEIPDGKGLVLSREQWLNKLAGVNYDPNKIWQSSDKTGVFVRINPTQGSLDKDVTAFRHVLVEFDHISIQEQWNLIKQSNIPCTAVLHSGGKSLHAWVRVDAKDWSEWKQRLQVLYSHFEPYGIDPKNKNPSRFSRLPGMRRGNGQQQLLAVNTGADSFSAWLIEQDAENAGQRISISDLLAFDSTKDENCILGNRWLCKGGSCFFIGPSGVGKSSLSMQAAITWGLGQPFFGIKPTKPLKSLFVQHENDEGDLAEMLQGVIVGMFNTRDPAELMKAINSNVVIIRMRSKTGLAFVQSLQKLIEREKPDLVWIDPFYTYLGDDISSQKVCSQFLIDWLGPVSEATGVCWMMMHHTGKPPSDKKSRQGWNLNDFAYLGLGSSIIVNWARAVVILAQHDDVLFQLKFAKRGKRAGATDLDGNHTTDIFLRHSDHGICWLQQPKPEQEPEPERKSRRSDSGGKSGRPKKEFDFAAFAQTVIEPASKSEVIRRAADYFKCAESGLWQKWDSITDFLTFDMAYDGWFFDPNKGA